MSDSLKITLLAVLFAAFLAVGFFIGKVISGNDSVAKAVVPAEEVVQPEEPVEEVAEEPVPARVQPQVIAVSKPAFNSRDVEYSFTVSAIGNALTYVLMDSEGNQIKTQEDSVFIVKPLEGGNYSVYVRDEMGFQSEKVPVEKCPPLATVDKVTKAELQNIFDTRDYEKAKAAGFDKRIASGCRWSYVGLEEGEEGAKSYSEIINRINMGTYSSVEVIDLAYDAQGRLCRAKIGLNY